MGVFGTFIAFLALTACAHPASISSPQDLTLNLEPQSTGGFQLLLEGDNEKTVIGHLGTNLVGTSSIEQVEGGLTVRTAQGANLTVLRHYEQRSITHINVKWSTSPTMIVDDCFNLRSIHWYGGPMQLEQIYPIEKAQQSLSPYYTKEEDNGAIKERYWLNSDGEYIYVQSDAPMFLDYNNNENNSMCFRSQIKEPYSLKRDVLKAEYDVWYFSDVKQAHQHAVETYLGKPSGVPDYRMVQHPIWSTRAQYSRDINEDKVLEFAQQISAHGFNNSQLQIDDNWETCYGSLTVDQQKFPNFTKTVQDIKELGFRVTIWVHPFINQDCDPWYSEALENGYFVLSETGSPNTTWWNSNDSVAGYIDFTNSAAAEWFYQRVKNLADTYGIDSFKFDAGESSFTPQIAVQTGDIFEQPHHIVDSYVRTCARFGNMIEVRTGFKSQDLPIFVRMVPRDSVWGLNNGLSTLLTTTFQMNLNGYTFVLPDMIGGNGFNVDLDQADLPSKELFIRWIQATTFLPAMQYSYAPWNFDNETVEISKKYTELHAAYAADINVAMQASVTLGTPVNAPLWWLDPLDEDALVIWDEYLLGEDIIVAPVLEEGAVSRDIYLPKGRWLEEEDPERLHIGPTWIRNYSAPLDVLPYFVREDRIKPENDKDNAATAPGVAAILILCAIIVNFLNVL